MYVCIGDLYICGCGGSDYVSGDRLRVDGDCYDPMMIKADMNRVNAACLSLTSMTSILDHQQQQHIHYSNDKYVSNDNNNNNNNMIKSPGIVQACMRPCTPDALPVMGKIPDIKGAFISCGHNCWGILWAPVCGKSMSELIIDDNSSSIDLTFFNPNRYLKKRRIFNKNNNLNDRGRKKGIQNIGEQW
jgi:hypothetical protein